MIFLDEKYLNSGTAMALCKQKPSGNLEMLCLLCIPHRGSLGELPRVRACLQLLPFGDRASLAEVNNRRSSMWAGFTGGPGAAKHKALPLLSDPHGWSSRGEAHGGAVACDILGLNGPHSSRPPNHRVPTSVRHHPPAPRTHSRHLGPLRIPLPRSQP